MLSNKGVTLIEMMIAITVIALLLGFGMPSYSTWIQNSQIRTATESIQNGLQLARAEAVRRNTPVQLAFDALPASTWTITVVNGGEQVQRRLAGDGSLNATVSVTSGAITTSAGAFSLAFNGLGRMTAPAAAAAINVDVPTAILAADKSRDLRIAVGLGGDVRMCDPNVTAGDSRAC